MRALEEKAADSRERGSLFCSGGVSSAGQSILDRSRTGKLLWKEMKQERLFSLKCSVGMQASPLDGGKQFRFDFWCFWQPLRI